MAFVRSTDFEPLSELPGSKTTYFCSLSVPVQPDRTCQIPDPKFIGWVRGCLVVRYRVFWVAGLMYSMGGWSKPSYADSMCWIQLEGPDWDTLWIMQMSVDLKHQAPATL